MSVFETFVFSPEAFQLLVSLPLLQMGHQLWTTGNSGLSLTVKLCEVQVFQQCVTSFPLAPSPPFPSFFASYFVVLGTSSQNYIALFLISKCLIFFKSSTSQYMYLIVLKIKIIPSASFNPLYPVQVWASYPRHLSSY